MSPAITEAVPNRPVTGSDRRRSNRLPNPPTIASGAWERVFDISLGGICLEGVEPCQEGDQLDLILTAKDCFHTTTIEAEVVWKRGKKVGLRWLGPDERQREWLQEYCA
jgi:hypothetical protein